MAKKNSRKWGVIKLIGRINIYNIGQINMCACVCVEKYWIIQKERAKNTEIGEEIKQKVFILKILQVEENWSKWEITELELTGDPNENLCIRKTLNNKGNLTSEKYWSLNGTGERSEKDLYWKYWKLNTIPADEKW